MREVLPCWGLRRSGVEERVGGVNGGLELVEEDL